MIYGEVNVFKMIYFTLYESQFAFLCVGAQRLFDAQIVDGEHEIPDSKEARRQYLKCTARPRSCRCSLLPIVKLPDAHLHRALQHTRAAEDIGKSGRV